MSKLVGVAEAAEMLDSTKTSLMSSACQYKKKHGQYPSWFISNGKRGAWKTWIDVEILIGYTEDERTAFEEGTNDIYWVLLSSMCENRMATELSARSVNYPKFASWRTFIRTHLFSHIDRVKLNDKITMRQEFVKVGREILATRKPSDLLTTSQRTASC